MFRQTVLWGCVVLVVACGRQGEKYAGTPLEDFSAPFYYGLFEIPEDNPLTVEGVAFGRMLFYDRRLSRDSTMSCASCHRQELAFTDGLPRGIGIDSQTVERSTMSLVNLLWSTPRIFWDGRAMSIEDQVHQPIENPVEMDLPLQIAVKRLRQIPAYREQCRAAFGTHRIGGEHVQKALAQFIRTLVSQDARYDRFLRGEVELTEQELAGMQAFFTHPDPSIGLRGSNCGDCHRNFLTDGFRDGFEGFANNGLDTDEELEDGLYTVSGNALDKGKFRVPSLRNIALTAPYMHDGRFATLEEVLDHYNEHIRESETLDLLISAASNEPREAGDPIALKMTEEEKRSIIAFLHTLTDSNFITNEKFSDPFTK